MKIVYVPASGVPPFVRVYHVYSLETYPVCRQIWSGCEKIDHIGPRCISGQRDRITNGSRNHLCRNGRSDEKEESDHDGEIPVHVNKGLCTTG
jgi:hypothetical protein